MNTATPTKNGTEVTTVDLPRFRKVECSDTYITATFSDDRIVSVPLWWSWRLAEATAAERANYQLIGAGHFVYWPDLDEHLGVQGFLSGSPAPRPAQSDQFEAAVQ